MCNYGNELSILEKWQLRSSGRELGAQLFMASPGLQAMLRLWNAGIAK